MNELTIQEVEKLAQRMSEHCAGIWIWDVLTAASMILQHGLEQYPLDQREEVLDALVAVIKQNLERGHHLSSSTVRRQ